jgi:hypothetical protein
MARWKSLAALLALVAITAGACSSGSTPKASSGSSKGPAGPGVTADTIKLGVTIIDYAKLRSVGIKGDWGDMRITWDALIGDVNSHGGVFGRKIVPVYADYSVIDQASAEAACVALTQDTKVFAVLAGFIGPNEGVNKCFADKGTAQVSTNPDPAIARTLPWITPDAATKRKLGLWANLLIAQKTLAGQKFAVMAYESRKAEVETSFLAPITKAGLKPTDVFLINVPEGDTVAAQAQLQTWNERMRSDGVKHVIMLGDAAGVASILRTVGFNGQLSTDNPISMTVGDLPLTRFTGTKSMQDIGDLAWNTSGGKACVKTYERANPAAGKIPDPKTQAQDAHQIGTGIMWACSYLNLFLAVAKAAGEPTYPALLNAITTKMKSFSFGQNQFASLGPDKFDANDGFRPVEFDPTLGPKGGWKSTGPLQNVSHS